MLDQSQNRDHVGSIGQSEHMRCGQKNARVLSGRYLSHEIIRHPRTRTHVVFAEVSGSWSGSCCNEGRLRKQFFDRNLEGTIYATWPVVVSFGNDNQDMNIIRSGANAAHNSMA